MTKPRALFRYQPVSAYSLSALRDKTIWLAKPRSFNDPFDCAITLDPVKYRQSLLDAITTLVGAAATKGLQPEQVKEWPGDKDAFETLRSSLKDLFQNMGICCFSAIADNLLMWSHYAQHHTGFCVEFDCSPSTNLYAQAYPVRYSDAVPSWSAGDLVGLNREEVFDSFWLTKASCWSYEQEWRVMAKDGDKTYLAPAPITAVVFGAKTSATDRAVIRDALTGLPVEFREAFLIEGTFLVGVRCV